MLFEGQKVKIMIGLLQSRKLRTYILEGHRSRSQGQHTCPSVYLSRIITKKEKKIKVLIHYTSAGESRIGHS